MAIIINTIFTILASITFLYFFWKKLKDDYSANQIFSTGFYTLMGTSVLYLVSLKYFMNYWFWAGFLGSALALGSGILKFKMRFFEVFEAWVIGMLSLLEISLVYSLMAGFNLVNIVNFVANTVLIFVFFYIGHRYKKYVWYRSGKVGFSGLMVFGLYFIFKASTALFSGIMSRVLIIESIFSIVLAFVSFLTIFNLSRKE